MYTETALPSASEKGVAVPFKGPYAVLLSLSKVLQLLLQGVDFSADLAFLLTQMHGLCFILTGGIVGQRQAHAKQHRSSDNETQLSAVEGQKEKDGRQE